MNQAFRSTHWVPGARASAPPARTERSRVEGIDAARCIGSAAVIVLHTLPTERAWGVSPVGVIDLMMRFAVPFFFIASGFLLSGRLASPVHLTVKTARRLGWLYLVWLAVYLLLAGHSLQTFDTPSSAMTVLLKGGPAFHLWFFPALGFGSAVVILGRGLVGMRALVVLTALMLFGAYAAGAYRPLIGIAGPPDRAGFLFAPALVLGGFWVAEYRIRLRTSVALSIALAGFLLSLIESAGLDHTGWEIFGTENFLVGTIPFAGGLFLASLNEGSNRLVRRLAALGRFSVGVYCIHLLIIWALDHWFVRSDLVSSLPSAIVVLLLSTGLVAAMARFPITRSLVT